MFFTCLCKQSSRREDVLDPLGCVLNNAFCNSIQIFRVETILLQNFYPIESVPKVNPKQPSKTKLRQKVGVTVTQSSHEAMSQNTGTNIYTLNSAQ